MRKNISKTKFIGKSILRKFVAISLAASIGFSGINFCTSAQGNDSDSNFSTEQAADSSLPGNKSNQPVQEDYLVPQAQNTSDDNFSCWFNFFCFIPAVVLTIFRIVAAHNKGFGSTDKKGN